MKRIPITDIVKPQVRDISAYTLKEYNYQVKINQNENPNDVPASLKKEILEFALERSWSRYPPFVPFDLYKSLAGYTGWKPDGISAGNGSNEIIQALMTIFLGPGDKLVIPSPTFTVYKLLGKILGANVVEIPLKKEDFSFDCDRLESEFLDGGKMILICSPNNPTGNLFPLERVERLLQKSSCPVVMDEAYFEFSKETSAGLLAKYDNLIVLRTFSKAFSLAGLRMGYGLMAPELAIELNKAKLPYNINFFTIAASIKLLERRSELAHTVEEIISERGTLFDALSGMEDVKIYPSRANFMIMETPFNPDDVFDGLLKEGFLVRNVSSYPMLDKALRVSVSTPEDNSGFLDALGSVLNNLRISGKK